MLDDRVRAVLDRLAAEDADERARGLAARAARAGGLADDRAVPVRAGRARRTRCEVLEIGGSRGYSTIWLAAGARILGGRVVSLEHDPRQVRGVAPQHRGGRADRVGRARRGRRPREPSRDRGRLRRRLHRRREGGLRVVLPRSRGRRSSPARLIVADNVLSHEETLGAYSRARQADPALESVTVPLDRGLELSVVLTDSLE